MYIMSSLLNMLSAHEHKLQYLMLEVWNEVSIDDQELLYSLTNFTPVAKEILINFGNQAIAREYANKFFDIMNHSGFQANLRVIDNRWISIDID